MQPDDLLRENLPLIERVTGRLCRRVRIEGADAEDVASAVKIALIENDYAILRGWEGRSSLATYLAVIIQRLLADEWMRVLGRWRPSAEAKRLGDTAVMIETLVRRDERTPEEALRMVRTTDPDVTREQFDAIVARLPERVRRPRAVELDEHVAEVVVAPETTDARAMAGDAQRLASRAAATIRETLASLTTEDRMLVRFRFADGLEISAISRMMRLPQRPLYRRMESLLGRLRSALTNSGIDVSDLAHILSAALHEIDFGLGGGKSEPPRQTPSEEAAR